MTAQESLALLDRAVQTVSTTREGHIKLQEAIQVLSEAIKAKDEKKK